MAISKHKVPHPGWECCEAPPARLRQHVEIARVRIALYQETCRNLREAAGIAKAESVAYAGRAYRAWAATGVSERSWDNLGVRLLRHHERLCAQANAWAMRAQMDAGNLERLIGAHKNRLESE